MSDLQSQGPLPSERDALDVSVVIVTWNSSPWIGGCLESVSEALGACSGEIIVVDNASEDDSTVRSQGTSFEVSLIANRENRGFAAAVNQGVAATRGRFLMLLNPDCRPMPRSIEILVRILETDERVAAAVPVLVDRAGSPQTEFQFRRLPTLSSIAAETLLIHRVWPRNPATMHNRYSGLDLAKRVLVEQPAAAALLLRRSVFEELGGMDEAFHPAWFEDVDLCARIARAGRTIVVDPAARAVHEGGASLDAMGYPGFVRVWYRNLLVYVRKWFSPGHAEAVRWLVIAGMIERIGATLVAGSPCGRREMIRTYSSVIEEAFRRWPETPLSS